MSRARLDTRPIRRRVAAGVYTAADFKALLDEISEQRQECVEHLNLIGRRRGVAAAALALDDEFAEPRRTS